MSAWPPGRALHRICARSAALRSTSRASSAPTPSWTRELGRFLHGAARAGVPPLFRRRGVADDGRLDRACHQLLDDVAEVPIARARRLRGHLALGAVPFLFDLVGRARRSLRSAAPHPDRHGGLHGVSIGWGVLFLSDAL